MDALRRRQLPDLDAEPHLDHQGLCLRRLFRRPDLQLGQRRGGVGPDLWISRAHAGVIHGLPVLVAPPEEVIWSKAFVCERERFDGADVNHIILARGKQMDWKHLLWRFAPHWEVLFAHLVLYRFSYPGQRGSRAGLGVARDDPAIRRAGEPAGTRRCFCRGMLIARGQYDVDIEHWGLKRRPAPGSGGIPCLHRGASRRVRPPGRPTTMPAQRKAGRAPSYCSSVNQWNCAVSVETAMRHCGARQRPGCFRGVTRVKGGSNATGG